MITLNISATGNPSTDDTRAMLYIVGHENKRRAALDPPEDELPVGRNLVNSFETVLATVMKVAHESYIQQAIDAAPVEVTKEDERSLRAALRDAESKGVSYDKIVSAIEAL